KTTLAVLHALLEDQPPAPRELNPAVPPALSDLVLRLLAKMREERPASAGGVAELLGALERELAKPSVRGGVDSPPRRRSRPGVVAALLAVMAGAALAGAV